MYVCVCVLVVQVLRTVDVAAPAAGQDEQVRGQCVWSELLLLQPQCDRRRLQPRRQCQRGRQGLRAVLRHLSLQSARKHPHHRHRRFRWPKGACYFVYTFSIIIFCIHF